MLELIGIMALWLFGLAASFYVPFLLCIIFFKANEIVQLIVGLRAAQVSLGIYVIASIAYLAAT